LDVSWKEIGGISGIVAVISLFERYIVRCCNFSKQRKKLRIYNTFVGSQNRASPEEILKRLKFKALEHDLDGVNILDNSLANQWGYCFRKVRNRFKGMILTKRYSIKTTSQLEPLLYELIQEGLLKTDGKGYWRAD
jgi:hypothetical protein